MSLTEKITVTNPIPDTLLEGTWEIVPHPNDPRRAQGSHSWMSLEPAEFKGNYTECQITLDTRKLVAEQTDERQLLLHGNAVLPTYSLSITVKTAPLITHKLPQRSLGILFGIALFMGWITGLISGDTGIAATLTWIGLILGLTIGSVGGLGAAFSVIPMIVNSVWIIFGLRMVLPFVLGGFGAVGSIVGFFIGLIVATATGSVLRYSFGESKRSGYHSLLSALFSSAGLISVLTAGFGFTVGTFLKIGFSLWIIVALTGTGLPLGHKLFTLYSQQQKRIANYRKSQRFLIKP
ncbi:MAG: sodium/proton-translocating pyrophosphatase [Moorea sp. SIO2B7]|nr:sodium/proton-translocating pyrophosphatase [Moorena sp. SIO2B7]